MTGTPDPLTGMAVDLGVIDAAVAYGGNQDTNRKVLVYLRELKDEAILCVANLSRAAQPVEQGSGSYNTNFILKCK